MTPNAANSTGAICVGDFQCYPIPDGDHLYPRSALCGEDPERTIGLPEEILVPYTPILVDTGSHRILIDTGAGGLAPSTGHLEESLARAGFEASDVDVVVLSHLHPDHIGGLALEDGTLRFPNARVLMSQREYDFWHSADLRSRLGTGSVYGSADLENLIGGWIDKYLPPVRDRLEWLADGSEIAPGIEAIDAPGHTPGHLAISISSQSESLLYAGDVLLLQNQILHPDWTSIFDLNGPELVSTRHQLLDRAATDRSIVFHYHFGDAGRFGRRGAQFAWEQLTSKAQTINPKAQS
jgi:glyoxylase-like metal-dependent hydrolase (beta-lactamase superfamily II)